MHAPTSSPRSTISPHLLRTQLPTYFPHSFSTLPATAFSAHLWHQGSNEILMLHCKLLDNMEEALQTGLGTKNGSVELETGKHSNRLFLSPPVLQHPTHYRGESSKCLLPRHLPYPLGR